MFEIISHIFDRPLEWKLMLSSECIDSGDNGICNYGNERKACGPGRGKLLRSPGS